MENLTIMGLPAHPLVVHALVVGVPVMALAAVAMLFRAGWRRHWAWPIAVADVLLAVTSLVARSTGEGLQEALGGAVAQDHAELGDVAPVWTGLMAAAAIAFALLRGRGRVVQIVTGAALAIASGIALVWIVLVGHSGAEAAWGGITFG
jgi:hypothetical protein